MKYFRALAPLTLVAGLALMPAAVYSDGLGLDVSPAKLELSMAPASAYNIPVTVHNSTSNTTHVQASMIDFALAQNGDYRFEKTGSRGDSLMRWASINPREFDLPAGTTQQVRLSLAVPSGNLNGEYAGIVFFQTRPVRRSGAVAFSARVATKIYMTIPGTIRIDGAIARMAASRAPAGELYRVLFKNTGNAHVYLRGQLQVQKSGQVIDRVSFPPEELVERGGDRLIEVTGKRLPAGKYQAVSTIDYGGKTMTGGVINFETQ
ncbi:MAG: DUF916 domain-containing protein [Candidatus Eremiobacteraeota bacterium]|nr:DUF916 domain-containing protein [Candidatus Eremiobacteraeota bacterium]